MKENFNVNMNKAGKLLRELRGIRTKIGVSRELGIPYSTYCSYESGTRCPNGRTKKLIADYFGRSVESIFFEQ